LPEIRLKGRIENYVIAIIENQIELYFVRSGTGHVENVELVAVGRNPGWIGTIEILPVADRLRRERVAARLTVLGSRFAPVGLPRTPCAAKPLEISVAVF